MSSVPRLCFALMLFLAGSVMASTRIEPEHPGAPQEPGKGKGGPPAPIETGASAALCGFQKAIRSGHWESALALCGKELREAVSPNASPEQFFRETVPVARLALAPELPICGTRVPAGGMSAEGAYYESFVRVLDGGEEFDISWPLRAENTAEGWRIDFPAQPFDAWLQQQVKERHERHEQIRQARLKLIPDVTRIATRLSAVTPRVRVGEPILLRLELVNNASRALVYDAQQVAVNDPLLITDANGGALTYTLGPVQTAGAPCQLPAGETAVLFDDLDVSRLYQFETAGRYLVQFRGRGISIGATDPALGHQPDEAVGFPCGWPSNVVTIEVSE